MERKILVIGNWKMHGGLEANQRLVQSLSNAASGFSADCAVCAPFPYLSQLQTLLTGSNVSWGAQTVSQFDKGAYTGEVSVSMLAEFGCRFVIVGHSERRALYGETDAVVAAKLKTALAGGLTPILCVGETLEEREAGRTEAVVLGQLDAAMAVVGVAALAKSVVAYEPVWAIGTGLTATPEQAQAVHAAIRARVAQADAKVAAGVQILYGGSVKAANAEELFAMADIDGGLVGGASLLADEFIAICCAAR